MGLYAEKALARRGVEICLNTRVTSMTGKEIFLTAGTPIPRVGKPILGSARLGRCVGGG